MSQRNDSVMPSIGTWERASYSLAFIRAAPIEHPMMSVYFNRSTAIWTSDSWLHIHQEIC